MIFSRAALIFALPLGEKFERVGVPVDTGAIAERVLLRDCRGTAPVDEVALDFFALRVSTDLAFSRVAPEICWMRRS